MIPVFVLILLLPLMGTIEPAGAAGRWLAWCRSGLMSEPRIKQGAGWMNNCGDQDDPTDFQTQAACLSWAYQFQTELRGKNDVSERSETGWRIVKTTFNGRRSDGVLGEVGCFPIGLRPPR